MEGATTEGGPLWLFDAKMSGGMFTGQLSTNPTAWNRNAFLVAVDQPRRERKGHRIVTSALLSPRAKGPSYVTSDSRSACERANVCDVGSSLRARKGHRI